MNNYNWDQGSNAQEFSFVQSERRGNVLADIRPLMRLVYIWMGLGLLLTAGVSAVIASNQQFVMTAANLLLPIIIIELVVVLALSWGLNRMSPALATGLFFVYAALNGVVFGVIFFAYIAQGQGAAITNAFLTTSLLFGAMTVVGYTTKIDLSKFGTFLLMGLIGLVIAMVVNIFLASSALDFIISIIGVLLFTALTAYDTQRIKEMAEQPEFSEHSDSMSKLAIFGALKLYLDFINLFLFLLRLFGGSRN